MLLNIFLRFLHGSAGQWSLLDDQNAEDLMDQKRYFVIVRKRFAQLILQEAEQDGGFPSVPEQTAMLLVQ